MKAVALALAVSLCACQAHKKHPPKVGPDAPPRTPASAIDPATTGSIQGVVRFQGTPPDNPTLSITEPACAKDGTTPHADKVLVQDGHLENVFVWVKSGLEKYRFDPPKKDVEIEQHDCQYHPLVTGVQVGQPLTFVNGDPVLHNIHLLPKVNDGANFPQPRKGIHTSETFTEPEVMIRTKCDVHPWMRAFVGVVDHPFFHVTGPDGAFSFKGLPPGDYVVAAWHEVYGTKEKKVHIDPKGTATAEFVFSAN